MAGRQELQTVVYCLGPIGGKHNPVITEGSGYATKEDYTSKGYARYIREARNIIQLMRRIVDYFLDSVKSEFPEDPLAFVDTESEEDLLASIQKMKKQWETMFKEHQKMMKESILNRPPGDPYEPGEDFSEKSSGSSSGEAKVPRMEPEEGPQVPEPETAPVEVPPLVKLPDGPFFRKVKEFGGVLKAGYQELSGRMGKALDRIKYDDYEIHDLKGFTLRKLVKFAKWKYALNRLDRLVPALESKLQALDLDLDIARANEKRLPEWMYFDDGQLDRKYHHRILIPVALTESIEEISAIIWWQIRRWGKLSNSLADRNWKECKIFKRNVEHWKYEVLYRQPYKRHTSTESYDTLYQFDSISEDT